MGSDKFKKLQFPAGSVIFQDKMMPKGLYIIESGTIEVFQWRKNRQSKIRLGVVGKGEFLGELALLSDQPHSSNAIAISDVRVVLLTKEAFDEQLKSNPAWLVSLIKGLVAKLHRTNEIVRRNGVIDEVLNSTVNALEQSHKREKANKQVKKKAS
jgi:CRP/FNR family transcriptional regulator, cyclic AMP receptor protein